MKKYLLLVVISFMGGCVTQGAKTSFDYPQVLIDSSLSDKLEVQSLVQDQGNTGMRRVQLTLVNETSYVLPLRHKIEWLDSSGMTVKSLGATWQADQLLPGEVRRMHYAATRPEVVDFLLRINGKPVSSVKDPNYEN